MGDRELKDQGNKLFLSRRYEDAISCYTKAIVCIKPTHMLQLNFCLKKKTIIFVSTVKEWFCPTVLYK